MDNETRATLLALTEATKIKGWYQPGDKVDCTFPVYLDLERSAVEICGYEPELIPGLLQTETYARVIMGYSDDGTQRSNDETGFHVTRRLRRQELLTDPHAPDVEYFLNEAALRRPICGLAAMVTQLEHLIDVSTLPNVALHVLPSSSGYHHGLVSGQLSMLRFTDRSPIACVDSFMGMLRFGQPHEIAQFTAVLRTLRKQSLSHRDSQVFMTAIAQELQRSV